MMKTKLVTMLVAAFLLTPFISRAGDPRIVSIAKNEIGTYKMVGYDSARVKEYCQSTDQNQEEYDEDGWCSGFVSWVLKKAGYQYASLNTNWEWINFADIVSDPEPGDLVIIPGHIAFFDGYSPEYDGAHDAVRAVRLLGGNQGHRVCELPIPEKIVTIYLRPRKAPAGWQPSKHYVRGQDEGRLDDKSSIMYSVEKTAGAR